MLLIAASLFFADPAPLEMPRAEAYLVRDADGRRYLEDRYTLGDLWTSRAVTGRWTDDEGRVFTLSDLAWRPPALDDEDTVTRADYAPAAADPKKPQHLREQLEALSPVDVAEEGVRPRQLPRGYRDVRYFEGTNESVIVCAYWPEKAPGWRLATWELAEGDDFAEARERFTEEFLEKEAKAYPAEAAAEKAAPKGKAARSRKKQAKPSERALLRADARHSVAAYAGWHFTDAEEFAVIDDLPTRGFVAKLTNDLAVSRAKYAAAVPSPLDGSNTLCVARLFASRAEYLDALEANGKDDALGWSAAYWCPQRRELVAYLPPDGDAELLKTIRHEAFHQYLSYACSMIAASPWLNEGYAQYFEDTESVDWGVELTPEAIDRLAEALPGLLALDYEQFYAGTDDERHFKYRLAWSIAVFLEKGADKVRFRPFAALKRDYVKALLDRKDMRQATAVAFGTKEKVALFVAEWKKFWKGL